MIGHRRSRSHALSLRRVSVCLSVCMNNQHSRHRSPVCPLELACPPAPRGLRRLCLCSDYSIGTSVLYKFMKQSCWWSIPSKLFEDSRYCLGLVSENFWDLSSRTKNRTSRSRKVLLNVSSRSRLGCNVKPLGLGCEGLVHIPGK